MSRRKPDPVTGEPQLTYRERIFINEYIKNGGNGKLAAIAAGYGAARADQSAYQVLHRIQVQRQIQDRISESDVCVQEIIGTLVSFMRGNISMLFDDDGNFDMDLVKERRLGHLLKTITRTTREIKTQPGQPPQVAQDYRIQLHSPVQAASVVARLLGLNRKTSDFESSDIAASEPSPLPDDLPDDRPDHLPNDLRADHYSEPPEPARQPGLQELLDPTIWMEALIKLEVERQGRSRSEVIEMLLQLRPEAAQFIRPEPDAQDCSSTQLPETPFDSDRCAQALDQNRDARATPDAIPAENGRAVETSLSSAGSSHTSNCTETLPSQHLKRIDSIIESLKKINTTQCLEQDSNGRPNTSPEPEPRAKTSIEPSGILTWMNVAPPRSPPSPSKGHTILPLVGS